MKRASIAAVVTCAAVCLVSGARSAVAQTQTDVNGYIARLDMAIQALQEPAIDPAAAIADARAAIDLPIVVTRPDGSSVLVTDESLFGSEGDGSDAETVEAMRSRLLVAYAGAERSRLAEPPDRAQVDVALAAAYGGLTLDQPSWVQRALARVGQALGWFLDHTLGALLRSGAGGFVGWLLVLGLAVGAILLARRVRVGVVPDARAPRGSGDVEMVDWQRFADDAIAAGDLNAAVPALYHVLVGTLAYRGVVRDAPSLTAGECRGAVRESRPGLAPSIDRATAAFERVAYGKRDAAPGDVEALREAQRAVRGR